MKQSFSLSESPTQERENLLPPPRSCRALMTQSMECERRSGRRRRRFVLGPPDRQSVSPLYLLTRASAHSLAHSLYVQRAKSERMCTCIRSSPPLFCRHRLFLSSSKLLCLFLKNKNFPGGRTESMNECSDFSSNFLKCFVFDAQIFKVE